MNASETMHDVYLGLGANLGDRETYLRQAVTGLQRDLEPIRMKLSSLYETDPVGVEHQPLFLNACLFLRTAAPLQVVHQVARDTETRLGRTRTIRWGPRTIDIDILLFDNLVVNTPELQIPHPRMHDRIFVMVPMAELAPELRHPVLGQTMAEIAEQARKKGGIRRWKIGWEGEYAPFEN
ncbi:2-amino-4-hydroxy-6-hydroxymethyldihydropteridine diphosphokinase [Kyrpidia sp.]|uniref:2-amino-4-hydroxy-6- hydroxymethyldihydropteridine diphosphokinase n=1 Tax=Kyrpidia sp. TaxID=2073077 RepID=UPI0025904596|nr:2-amino-4-hydroxy-6-hydroxymethyldihydropteridine diphosphokinase [Kyrpidia sp.]MCL6576400.1 2-amino-4-hydroxy-6-hydroxymethyldihydropteridine diphosphokinase [Kyrpidia sp.]